MTHYNLRLTEAERRRYRNLAEHAVKEEVDLWDEAGIRAGAAVADLGCGTGDVLVELARRVHPGGQAIGVDSDPAAIEATAQATAGLDGIELHEADLRATGLPPGSLDAAMARNVLAHNSPDVGRILVHVASIVRRGGHVLLSEGDPTGVKFETSLDRDLADLDARYFELLRMQGNDVSIGPRLGLLVEETGLELVRRRPYFNVLKMARGDRPPAWAATDAMRRAGLADDADVDRWAAAFARQEGKLRPVVQFVPIFTVLARVP